MSPTPKRRKAPAKRRSAAPVKAKRIGIVGTGMYVPPKVLTNADLEKMVDTSDDWIRSRTGIRERHIIDPGMTTSDLAVEAGKQALKRAGLSAKDIDLLIVATT